MASMRLELEELPSSNRRTRKGLCGKATQAHRKPRVTGVKGPTRVCFPKTTTSTPKTPPVLIIDDDDAVDDSHDISHLTVFALGDVSMPEIPASSNLPKLPRVRGKNACHLMATVTALLGVPLGLTGPFCALLTKLRSKSCNPKDFTDFWQKAHQQKPRNGVVRVGAVGLVQDWIKVLASTPGQTGLQVVCQHPDCPGLHQAQLYRHSPSVGLVEELRMETLSEPPPHTCQFCCQRFTPRAMFPSPVLFVEQEDPVLAPVHCQPSQHLNLLGSHYQLTSVVLFHSEQLHFTAAVLENETWWCHDSSKGSWVNLGPTTPVKDVVYAVYYQQQQQQQQHR